MVNNKEIRPVALSIANLCLTEGIGQSITVWKEKLAEGKVRNKKNGEH